VHGDLETGLSDAVAGRIREELARRRLSRQWLADEARISISTLEKALSGRRPFTLATVVRLEEALGLALRRQSATAGAAADRMSGLAPPDLGAYARQAIGWLEGDYLTLRPSFNDPTAVYAYRTLISWDEERGHLMFREASRIDSQFTQAGSVSFPYLSGHIYLVTNEQGQYRVAILGRPTIGGELHGVLTTLIIGEGSQLLPASTPLALVPIRAGFTPDFGLFKPGEACYEEYRARIERIATGGFARLISCAPHPRPENA
jgi:transcriptional regulator with XRE-family HTH domain